MKVNFARKRERARFAAEPTDDDDDATTQMPSTTTTVAGGWPGRRVILCGAVAQYKSGNLPYLSIQFQVWDHPVTHSDDAYDRFVQS